MANTSEPAMIPPTQSGSDRAESYRPLSLTAVLGFCLAILYAGVVLAGGLYAIASITPRWFGPILLVGPVVGLLAGLALRGKGRASLWVYALGGLATMLVILGLGGLVAFSGSRPYTVHPAVWILPILAAGLCLLAQSQINASEGTMAGGDLAWWGLRTAVFFALIFGAYVFSSTFAVRAQAQANAEEFMNLIRKGELGEAFIRTMPVRNRPTGDLNQALQIQNIARGMREPGTYTRFRQIEFVRLMHMGGDKTTWELRGAREDLSRGGYEVELRYRVNTPYATFEMPVTCQSQDVAEGGRITRSWNIAAMQTGTDAFEWTEEGKMAKSCANGAVGLGSVWGGMLTDRRLNQAYTLTLPDAKRVKMNAAIVGATGPGVMAAQEIPPGWADAILDLKDFWAEEKLRPEMLQVAKQLVSGKEGKYEVGIAPIPLVFFTREGTDRAIYEVEMRIVSINKAANTPQYMYEAQALIEGPLTSQPVKLEDYFVKRLRIVRGQTAPAMGPGGPPG